MLRNQWWLKQATFKWDWLDQCALASSLAGYLDSWQKVVISQTGVCAAEANAGS